MKKELWAGFVVGVLLFGVNGSVSAQTYSYDFTYDGESTTVNETAEGQTFEIGDTITATFNAYGNDFWSTEAYASIWTPIAIHPDSGTRIGDLDWTFSLDGSDVYSGSDENTYSSNVHIPGRVSTPNAIEFDKLYWEYTLNETTPSEYTEPGATTPLTNTLKGLDFDGNGAELNGATYHSVENGNTYGIFIGYDNYKETGINNPALDTDGDAKLFRDTLIKAGIIEGKDNFETITDATTVADIKLTLDSFKIQPEDTLYFYFSGHGGTSIYPKEHGGEVISDGVTSVSDEYVEIGKNIGLFDDDLFTLLNGLGDGVEKWVFLDACNSGGFWGNGEEGDQGDLDLLDNIALIAGASEDGTTGNIGRNGLFTHYLSKAYGYDDDEKKLVADKDNDGKVEPWELDEYLGALDVSKWLGETFTERAAGDQYPFSEDLWNPAIFVSDYFTSRSTYKPLTDNAVPEPTTILLFGTGIAGLAAVGRRRKN